MNYSTAVMLINPAIRAVVGQYEEGGKPETFKTTDTTVAIGDLVVVESSTRWGMTVVKVVEVDVDVDFDAPKPMGWVVQKVSVPAHEELRKMEAQAIDLIKKGELRKRREDIRKNTLDAYSAGEIDNLAIARLGAPVEESKA
jgi:hypothetical protein